MKDIEFIWYNPENSQYEQGLGQLYRKQKSNSKNPTGFTLLYKLDPTSSRIGQKLIRELNKARNEPVLVPPLTA